MSIITQNVDELHERAGSSNVVHLHGELSKVRSTADPSLIYTLTPDKPEIHIDDKCEKGSQLRPHIVWFGEAVPMIEKAIGIDEIRCKEWTLPHQGLHIGGGTVADHAEHG